MLGPSFLPSNRNRNFTLTEEPSPYDPSEKEMLLEETPNGWKPATVTKLANTPRSAIVTSDGTLYRRNRRDMIKTSQVGRDPCTQTPQGDKEACTKFPPGNRNASQTSNTVTCRTRSGRTVRSTRQKDFVYY